MGPEECEGYGPPLNCEKFVKFTVGMRFGSSLSVRFTSTPAVSLRWSNVWSFAANQLPLPPMKLARLGIGHAFRMPMPLGLSRFEGMILPVKHPLVFWTTGGL